jgi:hypothetical protein
VVKGDNSRLVLSVTRVARSRRGRQATRTPVSVAVGHRRGCRDGGLVPTSGIRLESARAESSQLTIRGVHSSRFRASGRKRTACFGEQGLATFFSNCRSRLSKSMIAASAGAWNRPHFKRLSVRGQSKNALKILAFGLHGSGSATSDCRSDGSFGGSTVSRLPRPALERSAQQSPRRGVATAELSVVSKT